MATAYIASRELQISFSGSEIQVLSDMLSMGVVASAASAAAADVVSSAINGGNKSNNCSRKEAKYEKKEAEKGEILSAQMPCQTVA